MEEHVLAYKLLLETSGEQVSQPVSMEGANQVQVTVWIESASTGLTSTNVVVTLQTSPDLDNWTDSSFTISLGSAPSSGTVETYGGSSQIAAPFIRLKYSGGGDDVLLGASVRLFNA